MPKLLVIEDDPNILEIYQWLFDDAGYDVHFLQSKPSDAQLIAQIQPDLLLSDWGLNEEILNWDFIDALQAHPDTSTLPIVICSAVSFNAYEEGETLTMGQKLNAKKIKILPKPFDLADLLHLVKITLDEQPSIHPS